MKKLILLTSIFFSVQLLFSQEVNNTDSVTTVIKDKRIDQLKKAYHTHYQLNGYRVQIYSGNKRQLANQARATFSRIYKKKKAHLDYEQPYYKVRAGDFKTKLKALKFKNDLVKHFPNCFIVQDKIDINEISAD